MSNLPDDFNQRLFDMRFGDIPMTRDMDEAADTLEAIEAYKKKMLADLKDFCESVGLPLNVQQDRPLQRPYRVFYPVEHLHEEMIEAFDEFFHLQIKDLEERAEGNEADFHPEYDKYDGE